MKPDPTIPNGADIDGFPVAPTDAGDAPRNALERIVDEFAERTRSGLQPGVEEYARRYAAFAEELRDVLPAVAALEQWKVDKESECLRRNLPHQLQLRRLGDCDIVREIGRGGMGVVFEAVQRPANRRVAVKLLPWRYGASVPKWRERFQREAATISGLRHPGIVPLLGFGEQDGYCYYVMSLVNGVNLDALIERLNATEGVVHAADTAQVHDEPTQKDAGYHVMSLSRRSWKAIARILFSAARAVAYAHQQGVIHNDLKPGNLMLDTSGRVLVGDFGLAHHVATELLEAAEGLSGTLRYMAPERFDGVCDARSDVYSLGVTLYEMVVRRPAFPQTGAREMMQAVSESRFEHPRQCDPQIPRDLESIIRTAMAADSAARYQMMEHFAADLRNFANDRPVSVRRRGWLDRWFGS
ncbi:MAG: serine/threonine protein kinase [Planctomycetaceae bacterium]